MTPKKKIIIIAAAFSAFTVLMIILAVITSHQYLTISFDSSKYSSVILYKGTDTKTENTIAPTKTVIEKSIQSGKEYFLPKGTYFLVAKSKDNIVSILQRGILLGSDKKSVFVHTLQLGSPAGPDFQMHWWQNIRPGTWRMWPLPWPGRKDRAGWLSLLTSFLLMLLIASVAVLLAILVFQNQQKVSPPAPVPSSESATGSGSGSGSPSQSSGEPSSGESSSGEPSELESRSDTPSMEQPSGDSSGPGSPSPERKL